MTSLKPPVCVCVCVQVREWLESVFAGEEVPEYEITPGTVEELWQLATASREKERRLETIVEDMEQKAHEYEAESEQALTFLMSNPN